VRILVLVAALSAVARADVPVGGACKKDAECAVGSICDQNVCTPLPKRKWIPPFYFEQGGEVGYRYLTLPPLYFSDWDRERKLHVAPEILLWAKTFADGGHEFGWLPFVFWRNEAGERTLAIPLLLAGMHATPERAFSTALLLWWRWQNFQRGTDHSIFLPFFEWESERHGRKQRFVSFFAAWDKDEDAGMKQLVLYAPAVYSRRDPLRDIDVVPPLFTRWRVHDDGSQGLIAGPFFHHSDPEGSTSGLIPLFFRFADTKAKAETDFLFPIAGWHKHPGAAGAFVGPIYGWRSTNAEGGWGGGIAPVFFAGRSGPKHHVAILPPLFMRWSNDREHSATTVVGPIFHRQLKDGSGWDAGVFPALWFGRRGNTKYTVIPPLIWARSSDEETLAVVGPIFGGSGKRGFRGGIAPILWFGRKDDKTWQFVLPPLFAHVASRDSEKLLVGPFWHEREGVVRTDSLFPLFYLRRTPAEALLVSPLGGWKKEPRKETIVVGLYGYQRNDRKKSRTHFFFPLGAIHDAPDYHVAVQFPFFWRVREKDETDTAFFPFYYRIRSDSRKMDALFPVFFHSETKVAKTTLLGPLWVRSRTDGGKSAGLFPLFAWGRIQKPAGRSSYFGMPGIYWAKNELAGTSDLVAGPVFSVTRPAGYTAGLIPLAFAWRRGTASKVVTPIFYRQAEAAWDYDLNVLGPIYWGKKGTERKGGLFPLLFVKWDKDGTSQTVLFPLVGVTKKKDGGTLWSTPLFGASTYAGGSRGWFGPFYGRRDREESSFGFWPLVYVNRNHVTGSSTTMALPFLFDGRKADGRELQMYSPLIWRYKSIESDISVGLPLWFDVKRPGESRTTSLLPFFVRNRSSVFNSTSWFFPPIMTWIRKHDGGGTDFSVFPLVWHFSGKEERTTVVFPLFWDFKRGESKTQVMFPLYARWARTDDDFAIYLNCYYRRGKGPNEGQWYVDVFPLTEFGRPRKGDVVWKLLEGFIGYSRTGRNRVLHLFWIFDIPLAPAPSSSLTWWSSTPPSARTEF
jgi:hypothetical protein